MTHSIPTPCRALAAIVIAATACGGGERAGLVALPDTLRFEPLTVGGLSPARVVEWSNAGADSLGVDELRLVGPGSADFILAEDLCAGATLGPGESCRAVVLFGPREGGARAATIAAGDAPAARVELRGDGIPDTTRGLEPAGLVRAVPETLDFGEQPTGAAAGPLGVRLVNQRAGAVQFAVRLRAGEGSEYRIALDRCSNEILGPGRACSIQVLFEPTVEGLRAGELILRDLNGSATQTVPLAGTGVAAVPVEEAAGPGTVVITPPARLVVTPSSLEFGLQAQGSAGPPRTVRVKNEGASNVVITSLRVAGGGSESFQIASSDCERRTLVPTRTCSLEVVFRPLAPGPVSARVEAQSSSGVLSSLVVLGGSGGAP